MKTKISRFSKSVLSVILAMTLIMSTMLIGTITVNAEITGLSALYFTPDSSKWADASATFKLEYTTSGGTNTRVPFELIDSENSVYKATLDSSTTYTKFKFWRYSSDGKYEWNSSNEFDTIPTGMNYFTKTSEWWNTWDPVNGNDGTYHGTWSTYSGGSGETETYYYVVGKLPDGTEEWNSTSNLMEKQSNGTYTWSYTNTSGSEKPYGVKVKSSKGTYYPDGYETEIKGTLNNGYTLTVTFDPSNNSVTADPTESVTTYTVKAGTPTGGTVTVGGSTSSVQVESGTQITVIATADENYEFVSWNAVDGVSFDDANSATTNATITKNATITATFRSKTTPSATYYFSYYDPDFPREDGTKGKNLYVEMTYNSTDGTYSFDFTSTYLNKNQGKFKITNSKSDSPVAADTASMCVNKNNPTILVSEALQADNVTVTNLGGEFYDIQVSDRNKEYKITFKPTSANPPTGTISVDYLSSTPTPKLSLSPTTANLCVNQTLQLTKTHTDHDNCDGTVRFESSATDVATVDASGLVKAVAKGTATITATCAGGEKATCTVTVSAIPNEQSDRIYAYAGTDATPKAQGWIAAEYAAPQQQVYNNDNETHETDARQFPSLGATTKTELRLFLPTSASPEHVVLYNSFGYDIKINDTTIPAGNKETVNYTPGTKYDVFKVTGDNSDKIKTLTIYKSEAQGALYLNNTGKYSSFDNDGVPAMLKQLYLGKDDGEIGEGLGNAGAYSDSSGVVNEIGVKKIKGRGNSTWKYTDKKSFNVTFTDSFNGFGFTQGGKKYSLLANFKDASLSRNKILYQLAEYMGAEFVPDVATVDLYMNGLYMGSYLMCQKIEVGKKEVVNAKGVTDTLLDTKTATAADAANGFSFLMELDSNATTGADYLITVGEQKITLKEPEYLDDNNNKYKDALTTAIDTFVTNKYTDLNNAISNTSITYDELNAKIDVKSLANYYLLNELAKNYDIGVTSTYLVYNKTEDKFYISPVWDLDVSTGNCNKENNNYTSYEGNWTNDNSGINYFMKKVFNNPQVQSAARAKWTESYYTELVKNINALVNGGTLSNGKTVTGAKTDISGSYENNFKKWSYPYGFKAQGDNIIALTSLTTASYDVNASQNKYSKASSATTYGEGKTAEDTINYVKDWLISRVAWMSHKYNTYTLTGLNGWNSEDAVTKSSDNGVTTWKLTSSSSTNAFKISTDGYAGKDSTHSCINYDPSVNIVNKSSKATISAASGTDKNFGFASSDTISESSPVFLIYNQKTNTLTLSDSESTSTNPSVRLKGSDVAKNEDIKDGTAVTLTATITHATSNNAVVTGDYTATLYIGEKKVTAKTVTFTAADDTKDVVFDTYLEGTNQTYKVVVTCNDGEQDLTGNSNPFTYKQTGIKDQKIYFDPSTYVLNSVATWLNKITETSTVTVTIKDSNSTQLATFKMYIDSEDVYGLAKGVFRADIDETTLGYLKVATNTIHFELDGERISTDSDGITINGDPNIESGWIYNYSTQTTDYQRRWEQYNVSFVEAYPSSRTDSNYSNITTFAQFKDYIAAQKAAYDKGEPTDNIVYFDNSASKWYNVYIYGWGGTGPTKDAVLMKKLPYADIWYYDFGSDNVTSSFLFKDRSSFGFGNNYQETVDLVNGYIKNGDGDDVQLFFEDTLKERANPIFVTQSFYNSTVKVSENSDKTLKYRAFNTQWDEFATILSNTVQTKAVDVYFDLHDKATDVKNIQLYHSSTNYTFASEFTRLTQMPGSTIFHAPILLPYTDNGIAFKFDKFVVNYSDGSKKTCKMSDKVQPTFTCINTGEVWYEINSNFASVSNDAAKGANLLAVNSPLLTANGTVTVYFKNALGWSNVYAYFFNDTATNAVWDAQHGVIVRDNCSSAQLMSPVDGTTDIYSVTFTGDYSTRIVFSSGTDQGAFGSMYNAGSVVYRNDLSTDKPLFTPASTSTGTMNGCTYYNNGSWSAYDPTPATTDYYVTGTKTLVNYSDADWNVKNESDKLVSNGDGTYSITYTNKDYNDNAEYYAFKITTGAWHEAGGTEYAYGDLNPSSSGATFSTPSEGTGAGNIQIVFNTQETSDITITFNPSAEDGKKITVAVTKSGSAPTPTISFTPDSISLTLVNGTASGTLKPTVTNASGKTVTYSVDKTDGVTLTPSADTLSAEFKATAAGAYVVTATIEGTTAIAQVTITVSEPVTTDYCGVLAYNHSTATFDVTGGGTINNTNVVLTNGYYTPGDVTTGYTSYDGTTYTVIYALPSTGKTDASTSYSSETSHSNEGTGEGKYSFDGWTKDGVVKTDNTTLTDSISGTATVAYVANWSQEVMVTYTFTYVYDMYDTKTNGKEYHEKGALTKNSDYKVQVSLSVNATKPDVIAAYLANAPKISSDYFTYTFDDTDVAISTDLTNHTAEATAKIASIKKYKVTFNNEDGIVSADEYFYQNIVKLTQSAPSGYVTVWKDEKGNTLYVGDSYSFRITRNIIIESKSVTSSSLKPATYVNEPTYEFFTSGTTEYVKFKVRVDNVLAGVTPDEYGTLYFFTDENGVPVDSTISVDSNIDSDKLTAAALGSASTGIKKYNATDIVNADHKFIYAPYIKNTAANRDRYLRVYSYYIYKDEEGNDVVVISSDSVLASIRNALNES